MFRGLTVVGVDCSEEIGLVQSDVASLESIDRLLTFAAQLLDTAASEIRDVGFDPQVNVRHVGVALGAVFDIQHRIYERNPELRPALLREKSPHSEANRLLTKHMGEALGLEHAGEIESAIRMLEDFIALESTPFHQGIARSQIKRLRGNQHRD